VIDLSAGAWPVLTPSWFTDTFLGIEVEQFIGLGVLIAIMAVVKFVLTRGLAIFLNRRISDPAQREFWDRERRRLSLPLLCLAIAAVILVGFPVLDFDQDIEDVANRIGSLIGAAALVLLAFRGIDIFSEVLAARAAKTETKMDDQLVPVIRTSLRGAVAAIGVLFVLSNLDVNIASLIAGVGLLGLAVALAAQDTVKNFLGGMTIFADKPFQIGDWIVIGDVEGTVEEVGLRSTRVRTFHNSIVTVPNYTFTDNNVDNMGARTWRRYSTTLGLSYSTTPEQMQAFVEGVRAVIRANQGMRTDYYIVEFKGFGASSLDVMLYCFINARDWNEELRTRHVLNLDIVRLAQRLRVQFAFPTQTLHVDSVPGQPYQAPTPPSPDQLLAAVNDFGPGGSAGQRRDEPLTAGYDNG
jgi:MscS family membrane protein